MNELAFAYPFSIFMTGMVKAVNAGLEKAVTLHVKNLQRTRDKLASNFTANVFFDAVGQRCSAECDTALIMVELDVVDKK